MDDERLAAYDPGEPAPDLADRVLARIDAKPRRAPYYVAALALVALVVFVLRPAGSGDLVASDRTTVSIAGRAVAVAEGGSALRWNGSHVEQQRGDVFYRVDRGGDFVVATPAGSVNVKGTCFKVEVKDMRSSLKGAFVGAGVMAAVLVTVYEGKVLLANEGHSVALVAGERGRSESNAEPRTLPATEEVVVAAAPSSDITRDKLLAREQRQREQIAMLTEKVKTFEEQAADAKERGAFHGTFVDPSKSELLELAKTCRINYDLPTLTDKPSSYGTTLPSELGLTPEERAAVTATHQQFNDATIAQLRSLYVEITGDTKGAAQLSASAMSSEIVERGGRDQQPMMFKRLSAERAGLVAPPSTTDGQTPLERYFRLMTQAGDAFEHDLAGVIGPERAHDARKANGGWNSKYGSGPGGNCPPD